ncbi:DUF2970 domain-containing protein [Sansalvadorimonas sp. 2012CJ34-2]|uniref:DUF2970 domain-containing protein n=1 Tax=Parendozoicomonas callyspongiae TaxID=2942213 RepID=A0ABT0PH66_9GAMM|nr:DUF2970 domain-containing protein [Sansalvadorimonas sp. 2012CJ34-2]MCL6269848.1 DUF2970 domain-containing protein [Sansalvadorimonas sp. 2012CJ34-2]
MIEKDKKPGVFSVIQSTLAAAFGVQSEKKRQQDFANGHPGYYIISGIIFTALFVVGLALLVGYIVD